MFFRLPQWEIVRVFQPDARTLVVRWRMQWIPGMFGAAFWGEQLKAGAPAAPGADDDGTVSVSVARLVESLKSAEKSLERGLSEVDAASTASAALNDALRSLREGVQQSQALASEVAAAEAVESLPSAGWLSAPVNDTPKNAKLRAELEALREDATSRVTGSSTFVLDADGLVVSHADTLDFDDAPSTSELEAMLERQEQAASRASAALAAAAQEAAAREERLLQRAASTADAQFQLCMAMKLPECGSWQWRLDVIRQLLWESFIRDEDTDDEMRISITREDFDELVNLVLAATAFAVFASTSYLAYWLVFIAPELPAQLSQFSELAPGDEGLAAMGNGRWLSSLSSALQPSLFR